MKANARGSSAHKPTRAQSVSQAPRMPPKPRRWRRAAARNADIENAYRSGASSYLVKPVRFSDFCELADQIRSYRLSTNVPPPSDA